MLIQSLIGTHYNQRYTLLMIFQVLIHVWIFKTNNTQLSSISVEIIGQNKLKVFNSYNLKRPASFLCSYALNANHCKTDVQIIDVV